MFFPKSCGFCCGIVEHLLVIHGDAPVFVRVYVRPTLSSLTSTPRFDQLKTLFQGPCRCIPNTLGHWTDEPFSPKMMVGCGR